MQIEWVKNQMNPACSLSLFSGAKDSQYLAGKKML